MHPEVRVKLRFYEVNAIKIAHVIVRCTASLYEMKSSKLSLYYKKLFCMIFISNIYILLLYLLYHLSNAVYFIVKFVLLYSVYTGFTMLG